VTAQYIPNISTIWQQLDNWNEKDYVTVSEIKTKSHLNYPISKEEKNYPILIFSPSLGGNTSYYNYYAEKLAQWGFIVVGVNHLYESEYVIGADKSVYPHNSTFHDSIENLKIPEQITSDQFRELKSERMKVLGDDIIFCLNQLELINPSNFENRINLNKVGGWGHSIGGAAVTYASILDNRILAVLNMDGTPPSVALNNGIDIPFMFLEDFTDYENHSGYKMQYDRRSDFCAKGNAIAYRILIEGINHNSFLDVDYYTAKDKNEQNDYEKRLSLFLEYMIIFYEHTLNREPIYLKDSKTDSLEIIVFAK